MSSLLDGAYSDRIQRIRAHLHCIIVEVYYCIIVEDRVHVLLNCKTGPGCSKLMKLLVNISLKFQTLISQICQYFLLKK